MCFPYNSSFKHNVVFTIFVIYLAWLGYLNLVTKPLTQ